MLLQIIFKNWFMLSVRISSFIIQHIVTMSKINMVIARSIFFVRTQQISCDIHILCVEEKNGNFSKLCFVIDVLNNKTIILLNLSEYRLTLANSAYGLVG